LPEWRVAEEAAAKKLAASRNVSRLKAPGALACSMALQNA